jgi:hypothetical protein
LHQAGRPEALACFRETEAMQKHFNPRYPLLFGAGLPLLRTPQSSRTRSVATISGLETGTEIGLGQARHEASQRWNARNGTGHSAGRSCCLHYLTLDERHSDLFLRATVPFAPARRSTEKARCGLRLMRNWRRL